MDFGYTETQTGLRRSQRKRRTLATAAPYPQRESQSHRSKDSRSGDGGRGANANAPQVALLPRCARQGIQWFARSNQPLAAWESMLKPHENANTSIVNFLFTLTARNIEDDMIWFAQSEVSPQDSTRAAQAGSLYHLATACRELDRRRNGYDFHSMIALIRLSFECAR